MKHIIGYVVNTFRYGSENRYNLGHEVDLQTFSLSPSERVGARQPASHMRRFFFRNQQSSRGKGSIVYRWVVGFHRCGDLIKLSLWVNIIVRSRFIVICIIFIVLFLFKQLEICVVCGIFSEGKELSTDKRYQYTGAGGAREQQRSITAGAHHAGGGQGSD